MSKERKKKPKKKRAHNYKKKLTNTYNIFDVINASKRANKNWLNG
jgi:hypothetical protein